MTACLQIRESGPPDTAAVEALYADAFPDEDLLPLVRELLQQAPVALSLVAVVGASIAGHVVLTACSVAGSRDKAALLGPLAVAPTRQRRGIGSAIVRAGLQRLENAGVRHLYVLGDPGWYRRLGFGPEPRVAPPYPLPVEWREAWQSISLGGAVPPRRGRLCVPQPWRRPALWAP